MTGKKMIYIAIYMYTGVLNKYVYSTVLRERNSHARVDADNAPLVKLFARLHLRFEVDVRPGAVVEACVTER